MSAELAAEKKFDLAAWIDDHRTQQFEGALLAVGKRLAPTEAFDQAADDLEDYLGEVNDYRPSFFCARELSRAKYPEKAGANYLVPPTKWWPRVALLQWFADLTRRSQPVRVAHLYRPEQYNASVGSKSPSHAHCCAIDLDFTSAVSFGWALEVAEALWRSPANFCMGLGVGTGIRRLHVDFWSPASNGRPRWWSYDAQYKGPAK
jgi:hypothetical protein